jgi:hypothetical protein
VRVWVRKGGMGVGVRCRVVRRERGKERARKKRKVGIFFFFFFSLIATPPASKQGNARNKMIYTDTSRATVNQHARKKI